MRHSIFGLVALLTVAPLTARAQTEEQDAPVGAQHFSGLDTGSGPGYSTSIPLDLPPARGGLPIPLSLALGGSRLGAMGRGGDVQLSFISDVTALTKLRPIASFRTPPAPRRRVTLSLMGEQLELILKAADGTGDTWVPQRGHPDLLIRRTSATRWSVIDGDGLVFIFEQKHSALQPLGVFLLDRIEGPAAKLTLQYTVTRPHVTPVPLAGSDPLPGSGYDAVSIDLAAIRYDYSASGSAKHELVLTYDDDRLQPLSIAPAAGGVVVRSHVLRTVSVQSRATQGDSPKRLLDYHFAYLPDADTGLPQLSAVTITGRQDTQEESTPLPVAQYEYGAATSPLLDGGTWPDGGVKLELRYEQLPAIPGPLGSDYHFLSQSTKSNGRSVVPQQLVDVTGDGRVDMVFETPSALKIGKNRPGTAGITVLDDPALNGPLGNGPMTKRFLDSYAASSFDPYPDDVIAQNTDQVIDTWTQLVDVNGDGRPDYIDASEVAEAWVVYFNVPASGAPQNITWVRRVVNVRSLREQIEVRGTRVSNGYVPLMRQYVTGPMKVGVCWRYDRGGHQWNRIHNDATACLGRYPYTFPHIEHQPGTTSVAWKLADFNGDGAIDLLLASVAPGTEMLEDPKPCLSSYEAGSSVEEPGRPGCFEVASNINPDFATTRYYRAKTGSSLHVAFNHQDVTAIFPIAEAVNVGGCGAGQWGERRELCALTDVDGDGLIDSVQVTPSSSPMPTPQEERSRVAYLGTGGAFSAAYFALPGPTAYEPFSACSSSSDTNLLESRAGLRDLTGDGIPDSISDGNVRIGTGAGYGPTASLGSILKNTPLVRQRVLSTAQTACDGSYSRTIGGWYDLDGDGRPEKVEVSGYNLVVYRLVGRRGTAPESRALSAGQLVSVGNGHGGLTLIGYASAKDDGATLHQLPFPEVVVGSIRTWQASNAAISDQTFAYGDARLDFDSMEGIFRSYGYGRSVVSTYIGPGKILQLRDAVATLTDRIPLEPVQAATNVQLALARHLMAGQPKRVTVLAGELPDAWSLLTTDVQTSGRVTAASDLTYDVKHFVISALAADVPGEPCTDATDPYGGISSTAMNTCKTYGFVYPKTVDAWRGRIAPPSDANVRTSSEVQAVDDFGRVTRAYVGNDARRADDDICIQTSYAAPQPAVPGGWEGRVLTAVAQTEVLTANTSKRCLGMTLSRQSAIYDRLPAGQVREGFVTSRLEERRETQTGVLLDAAPVRHFDATYDSLGNVVVIDLDSGDGRTARQGYTYDVFGLALDTTVLTATGAGQQSTRTEYDPVSLLPTFRTNSNGTRLGMTYDGFGREVLSTIALPSGTQGALSLTRYLGFGGGDPLGRRIELTRFDNPVANATSATGHRRTTFIDDFGRPTRTVSELGTDYTVGVVSGLTQYDGFGRVTFEADAFHTGQNEMSAYGTSYFYELDGYLKAMVRGHGKQTLPSPMFGSTSEAFERYPVFFAHDFIAGEEVTGVWAADSLLTGSPQEGVMRQTRLSATGRLTSEQTWGPSQRLEYMDHGYDRLGNVIMTRRYRLPGNAQTAPSDPVQMTFGYDSFGQLLRQVEPAMVQRDNVYSNWGELLETKTAASTIGPTPARSVQQRYDGLGRLIHSEQRSSNVVLADTVYDYTYDAAQCPLEPAKVSNRLGRLAWVRSPGSTVCFGYDDYGHQNSTLSRDPIGKLYLQSFALDADGAAGSMAIALSAETDVFSPPPESMKYQYDSARRLRQATFFDKNGAKRELFVAKTIDPFGRLRDGTFGKAQYLASYADEGRRLFIEDELRTPSGRRRASYVPGYDPVGRERGRTEKKETGSSDVTHTYDARGQLSRSKATGGLMSYDRGFAYDALGNLTALVDQAGSSSVALRLGTVNRDQLCSIGYGIGAPAACNVTHDANGNVIRAPARTGMRDLEFLPSGKVSRLSLGSVSAAVRYDAFGEVQELDVAGAGDSNRTDRRYGLVEQRQVPSEGTVHMRSFPVGSMVATRRGQGDSWTLALGEQKGNRFFVDQDGEVVQEADYLPYGEAKPDGVKPDSRLYSRELWNGRDSLEALGVSQLGARFYDPVIGRFLSPDPLVLAYGAGASNPYAFAINDPVNFSDPEGLCVGEGCNGSTSGGGSQEDIGDPNRGKGRDADSRAPSPPKRVQGFGADWDRLLNIGLEGMAPDQRRAQLRELRGVAREVERIRRSKAEIDRMCANMPRSCDDKLDDSLGAEVARGLVKFFVPTIGAPSYYIRASDTRVIHFGEMSGPEYFRKTGDALGARAAVASGRFTERVTMVAEGANGLQEVLATFKTISKARTKLETLTHVEPLPLRGGCFAADTPVLTESGEKPISEITVGEQVWALDSVRGVWGWHPVTNTSVRPYAGSMVVLRSGGDEILATPNHPVCIAGAAGDDTRSVPADIGKDPLRCGEGGRWVEAGELRSGDFGWSTGAPLALVPAATGEQTLLVYNLKVEGAHAYLVGHSQLLVHNQDCRYTVQYGPGVGRDVPIEFQPGYAKNVVRYNEVLDELGRNPYGYNAKKTAIPNGGLTSWRRGGAWGQINYDVQKAADGTTTGVVTIRNVYFKE